MSTEILDEKEKLLVEFMVSSHELFIKALTVIKPEYFEQPLDEVVSFVISYFRKYKNTPNTSIIEAETGVSLETHDVTADEFEYVVDEVEKHCQFAAMRLAILEGAEILSEADDAEEVINREQLLGSISSRVRDALTVTIDTNIGMSYFDDPVMRLLKMQETIDATSIGWTQVDMLIDKVKRSEVVIFAGNSGSGKSVILANIARNMILGGKNALIISLELNESLIAKRIDSIMTGIYTKEVFDRVDDIAERLEEIRESNAGQLHIKRMPVGTNSNQIKNYLLEYELQLGRKPDVIIVDYLDLMGTNEKPRSTNAFDIDKAKTEELREILEDYGAYGFTASQLNRESVDAKKKTQAHIAGGLSKINTADVVFGIIRDEDEIAAGIIQLQLMKLRNAEFTTEPITMSWDSTNLRIEDKHTKNQTVINKSSTKSSTATDRLNSLLKKGKTK